MVKKCARIVNSQEVARNFQSHEEGNGFKVGRGALRGCLTVILRATWRNRSDTILYHSAI